MGTVSKDAIAGGKTSDIWGGWPKVKEFLFPFIDVTSASYGATGDGETDDTIAIQAAFDEGWHIYFPPGEYVVSDPILSGDGHSKANVLCVTFAPGASIDYTYEQDGTAGGSNPDDPESAFNFLCTTAQPLSLTGVNLSYSGTFSVDPGGNSGRVNGVHIAGYEDVSVDKCKATGFNYGGLCIGASGGAHTTITTKRVNITRSNFSENREAGIFLSNSEHVLIEGNHLNENGLLGESGEGYGVAGVSGTLLDGVIVRGNICNGNHRKGIDFHSGKNLVIANNICIGNKMFGIFAATHTESVIIEGNTIADMLADDSPTDQIIAIQVGRTTTSSHHKAIVRNNLIRNFRKTNTSNNAYPFYVSSGATCRVEIVDNEVETDDVAAAYVNQLVQFQASGGDVSATISRNKVRTYNITASIVQFVGAAVSDVNFSDNQIILGRGRYFQDYVVSLGGAATATIYSRTARNNTFSWTDEKPIFSIGTHAVETGSVADGTAY